MPTIPVLLDPSASQPQAGSLGLLDAKTKILEVDADKLRGSLADFSRTMGGVLKDIKQVGDGGPRTIDSGPG